MAELGDDGSNGDDAISGEAACEESGEGAAVEVAAESESSADSRIECG